MDVTGVGRVYIHRAATVLLYPLVNDNRITWYVNDYEKRNTNGLGAYWGYLFGALDRRNFAMAHHAPLDESTRSAVSATTTTTTTTDGSSEENSMTEIDQSEIASEKSADENEQSSIFTYLSTLSAAKSNEQPVPTNSNSVLNGSNGQSMPTNSMPNKQLKGIPVSVIVSAIAAPSYQPQPVLRPADHDVMLDWADDRVGEFTFQYFE